MWDLHVPFDRPTIEGNENRGGSGGVLAKKGAFHDFVTSSCTSGGMALERDPAVQHTPLRDTNHPTGKVQDTVEGSTQARHFSQLWVGLEQRYSP
ncbi:hypothetical protein PO909_030183 [Leuciscus waleckii]